MCCDLIVFDLLICLQSSIDSSVFWDITLLFTIYSYILKRRLHVILFTFEECQIEVDLNENEKTQK